MVSLTPPWRRNLHLTLSTAVVLPAGLLYGAWPDDVLPAVLDVPDLTNDLRSQLRAVMMLYLGSATLWIIGIFDRRYWYPATLLCVVFMSTIALGRMLSWLLDGSPSWVYQYGLIGEVVLAVFSGWQWRRYGR